MRYLFILFISVYLAGDCLPDNENLECSGTIEYVEYNGSEGNWLNDFILEKAVVHHYENQIVIVTFNSISPTYTNPTRTHGYFNFKFWTCNVDDHSCNPGQIKEPDGSCVDPHPTMPTCNSDEIVYEGICAKCPPNSSPNTDRTACVCNEPSDPTPTPPKDTNTTEWKLVGEVSCKDENATLPDVCTDANASSIVVQSWETGCCGTNKRCYQAIPKCDENQTLDMNATPPVCVDDPPAGCDRNDTEFPALKPQESVLYEWAHPDDLSSQCISVDGNIQHRTVSCVDHYRCTCPYEAFPDYADNEKVWFKWSENSPVDQSDLCLALHGHIQKEHIACITNYRCVGESEELPKECKEQVGSYVSPRDGVFHEDIALLGVAFGLHYASNERNNTLAQGWMPSNYAYLKDDKLHLGSGSIFAVDTSLQENGLSVITHHSNEYLFDGDGTLQRIRDLYTKETKWAFAYDNMGRLITITDMYGEMTIIERDANGTVTAIIAPTGQRTLLSIDSNGDLIEVQYEDTTSYAFIYEKHLMTEETEPNGNRFVHIYDSNDNIVKVIDAEQGEWGFESAYHDTDQTHTVIRASGDVIRYTNYFLENNTTLRTVKQLPSGEEIVYAYTVDDTYASTTMCGMKEERFYKRNDDGTLYRDPIAGKRVLKKRVETSPSGLQKETHFTQAYRFDENGTLKNIYTTATQNGKRTESERDYPLHRAWVVTPLGKKDLVSYDTQNRHILSIDPYAMYETKYTYDDRGRVIKEKTGYRETHYGYDSRGNLASVTDPLGRVTAYAYDERDRLTGVIYPDGSTLHFAYDANGNMTLLSTPTPTDHTFAYNGVNKPTNYNSPMGATTMYTYDKQRRVTQITKPSGASIQTHYLNGRVASVTTPESTTSYTYACQSNISQIDTTPLTGSGSDESMHYIYDGTLLTSMTQAGVLNETVAYSYNNDFLVSGMTYAGATTHYDYNSDGELTQAGDFSLSRTLNTTLSQTLTDGTYTQQTHYNGYGEVASQEDGRFGYTLERNAAGQIVTKVETLEGKKVTYAYLYDKRARLVGVTKNGIETEAYSYDANGNRASATVKNQTATASYTLDDQLQVYGQNTYRYNDDGYLVEKTTPQGTSTYTYNTLGALTQATVPTTATDANWHVYDNTPEGATISTVYDDERQSNVIAFNGSGTANGYRLGYTGDTNPNSWQSMDKTIQWSMNFAENYYVFISVMTTKGHRYIYYNQADTDLGLRSNGTYIHLGLGSNSKNGTWQTFTRDLEADLKQYEPDNELLTVNGFLVRGSGRVDDIAMIHYGNETVKDDAEGTTITRHLTYEQNALNQRAAKLLDGEVVEKYLWADLTTLLAIYDKDDNLIHRFEYADQRMPVAMMQNNQKYYLHYDQVGSLRAVSDTNGHIIKEIVYDTYGNIISDSNPSFKVPFGFAGGLYDPDTKLTHFGYREYDAYTGKWTAKDPIGFAGGDSNLYGYVLGDPVNGFDANGLNPIILEGGLVGAEAGSVFGPVGTGIGFLAGAGLAYYTGSVAGEAAADAVSNWWDFPKDEAENKPYCEAKKSGKEKASDAPSWAKGNRPNPNQKCQDFAKQLLDTKYGAGNWRKGANSEYNKIVKWCQRSLK